eukprot:gene3363-13394_t
MVKQVDLVTVVERCTAQHFFDVVYAHKKPMQEYHALANKDPNADVTDWDDGVRTISFCMPLQIPAFVKAVAGVDSIRVREQQSLVWKSSELFDVTSETAVQNVPVSELMPAMRLDEFSQEPGVEMKFSATCAANMSIENIMVEKAQVSMQDYFDFIVKLLMMETPPPPAMADRGPSTAMEMADLAMFQGDVSRDNPQSCSASFMMRRYPTMITTTTKQDLPPETAHFDSPASVLNTVGRISEQGSGTEGALLEGEAQAINSAHSASPSFFDAIERFPSGAPSQTDRSSSSAPNEVNLRNRVKSGSNLHYQEFYKVIHIKRGSQAGIGRVQVIPEAHPLQQAFHRRPKGSFASESGIQMVVSAIHELKSAVQAAEQALHLVVSYFGVSYFGVSNSDAGVSYLGVSNSDAGVSYFGALDRKVEVIIHSQRQSSAPHEEGDANSHALETSNLRTPLLSSGGPSPTNGHSSSSSFGCLHRLGATAANALILGLIAAVVVLSYLYFYSLQDLEQ